MEFYITFYIATGIFLTSSAMHTYSELKDKCAAEVGWTPVMQMLFKLMLGSFMFYLSIATILEIIIRKLAVVS